MKRLDGEKIKALREEKGMSREALAIKTGISERDIKRHETDIIIHFWMRTVRKYADALGVKPEALPADA